MPRPDDGTPQSRRLGPRARGVAWNGFLLVSAVLLTPCLLVQSAQAWMDLNPERPSPRTIYLPIDTTRASHRRLETLFRTLWRADGHRPQPYSLNVSTGGYLGASVRSDGWFSIRRRALNLPDSLILALLAHEIGHYDFWRPPLYDFRLETLEWQADVVARLGGAGEADVVPNVRYVLEDWFACLWFDHPVNQGEFEADSAGAVLLSRMGYAGPRVMANLRRVMLAENPEYPLEFCGSLDPSLRDLIRALDRQAARDRSHLGAAGRRGGAPEQP